MVSQEVGILVVSLKDIAKKTRDTFHDGFQAPSKTFWGICASYFGRDFKMKV